MTPMLEGCTPWPPEFVDRYWAAGHWRGHTLDNLLRGWALEHGPRTALVHGATRTTYAHLNRRVDRMAAGFRLRGLRPGQRVVVQLPNVPEFVTTVFALIRLGAHPVLCPLSYRAAELSHVVRVAQAVGYVGPSAEQGFDHMATAADIAAQGPFLRQVFTFEAPGTSSPYGGMTTDPSGCHYSPLGSVDAPPEPALAQSADQVAFFLAGADGAGAPLLVPRTHNDYVYQARAAAELVSLTENDVYLAALPAGSALALGCPGIIGTLSVGGTVVLAENPAPAVCLPAVERERVTITSLRPAHVQQWLDELPNSQADMGSLRLLQVGGGVLPGETAERTGRDLGCRLQQVFVMPEGPLTVTRPADPDTAVLAAQGRPLSPDDEFRLVDAAGEDVREGEVGELLVRGPYTSRGYYRAPDENARAFTADGYFRTGNFARRTQEGGLGGGYSLVAHRSSRRDTGAEH
ncbi:AMP-binding protein [Streptomyces crystallinus]|uniref:(2,3-dihydroxybenzoyl)adenylate synthase n=1 Tax=Streptomyces crystallinus TaxID=68191 RepID=A0ABP3QN84_9ACTN